MKDQYEDLRQNLKNQHNIIEESQNVMNVLEMRLTNDSEKTDYGEWRQASARFANDNETLLKAMMK